MLNINSTALVFIDVQEKLHRVINEREQMTLSLDKLLRGLAVFKIPVIHMEQNPAGLGFTIQEIRPLLPEPPPLLKMTFSCCGGDGFMEKIESLGRRQLLICGEETHICVYQTAMDLHARGYQVEVVTDCVGSRTLENKNLALNKMAANGIGLTGMEMVLFELLRRAGTPEFKEVSRIVK